MIHTRFIPPTGPIFASSAPLEYIVEKNQKNVQICKIEISKTWFRIKNYQISTSVHFFFKYLMLYHVRRTQRGKRMWAAACLIFGPHPQSTSFGLEYAEKNENTLAAEQENRTLYASIKYFHTFQIITFKNWNFVITRKSRCSKVFAGLFICLAHGATKNNEDYFSKNTHKPSDFDNLYGVEVAHGSTSTPNISPVAGLGPEKWPRGSPKITMGAL